MPEMYDMKEIPEGTFLLTLKTIDSHQHKYPRIKGKQHCAEYQKGYF